MSNGCPKILLFTTPTNLNVIEGSILTLKETASILKEGVTIDGKQMKHHLEAIGHKDAYYYVEDLDKNKTSISERVIKDIHSIVPINRQEDTGIYHSVPVHVGVDGAERLMFDYDDELQKLHVVEKSAIFHLRFETIHPFIDGNGRMGGSCSTSN